MLRIRPVLLAAFLAACAPSSSSAPSPKSADLLIRGGTVYDGDGGNPYSASLNQLADDYLYGTNPFGGPGG